MNILFTTARAPSSVYFPTNEKLFPLGIGYLSSVLREAGHEIHFLDPYYETEERHSILYLETFKIDVVGIYVNTICSKDALSQICEIRAQKWHGRIIVGGPHFSFSDFGHCGMIDHVVIGEAEEMICEIVSGNLMHKYKIKCPPVENLDDLPRPAYDLIGKRDYRCHDKTATNPVFNMNTSRGCPYNCSFCSSGPISGRKYRFQSSERIIDDILWLKSTYDVGSIYFRENNFCVSKKRTIEFCETILRRDIDIEWRCEATVKDLPRETLILMKKAGCKGIFVGFETGSARLLPLLKPGFDIRDNIETAKNCRELEIPLHASFLVGTPYEIKEDERETIDFIDKYIPKRQACINVYIGLVGSKIYNELNESGDYDYKDDMGLIYTRGHDDRIRKYFKITPAAKRLMVPTKGDQDARS